jgi:hypothetical protein
MFRFYLQSGLFAHSFVLIKSPILLLDHIFVERYLYQHYRIGEFKFLYGVIRGGTEVALASFGVVLEA